MKLFKLLPVFGMMLLGLCSCNNNQNQVDPNKPNQATGTIQHDGRVGYQVFVSSFCNGNPKNDGSITADIDGIIKKLDFLKEQLNVEVLWLTPIHNASTYHGYDVTDYRSVKIDFGGMEAYQKLLDEAHKRGMYVMLDLVINHTSKNAEWFYRSSNREEGYRDYYRWTKTRVTDNRYRYKDEFYYACFVDNLPDLNWDSPKLYAEMLEICKSYIDMGVDGFRVDGAKHVYNYSTDFGAMELYEGSDNLGELNWNANLNFFNKLNKDLKAYDKDCFVTLEVLDYSSDAISHYLKQGVDSCFDFSTRKNIIDNINSSHGEAIPFAYESNQNKFMANNQNTLNSLILSNHDMNRAINDLGFNDKKAKTAAALTMLMPGLSWIYNGDELGMSGTLNSENYGDLGYRQRYKWQDESELASIIYQNNNSNDWDAHNKKIKSAEEQASDPTSMLSFYKAITNLKANDNVFRYGDFKPINLDYSVSSFTRTYNGKTYLVAINTSSDSKAISYSFNNAKEIFKYGGKMGDNQIILDGYGMVVIQISNPTIPNIDKVVFHYKGPKDYELCEYSTGKPRWIKLSAGKDGYRTCELDVKGKDLIDIEFLFGKEANGVIETLGKQRVMLKDDGNRICNIYVDDTARSVSYEVAIDKSWPFKDGQEIKVWAWQTDGAPGSFYNAKVENGKVLFTLDKALDNLILVVFDKGAAASWDNKKAQTIDLKCSGGKITTPISWK